MEQPARHDHLEKFVDRMTAAGLPDAAIAAFRLHYRRLATGDLGTLGRDRIDPVAELPDTASIDGAEPPRGAVERAVVIKLNGGLGTSMGLERAKSLIEVRRGATFLDLIARQVLGFRRRHGSHTPLLLMNSFRTAEDSAAALADHPGLAVDDLPLGFSQHRVPKILADDLSPARWPDDPELEWCPPGHGDVYTALVTSGLLDELLDRGFEVAFISNSDNLGAVLDVDLLGHMVGSGADFMMEVADRTPADRKGGHLARLKDGRLVLRESAQCPPDERDEFQDIDRYRYFNTNNIWVSLPGLAELLDRHGGVLPLDTIVNRKTVDPRDPSSPDVIQLETAMGAAISLFDHAVAVRVPRTRFSPVKNTDDLLGVRSDAYRLTGDARVVLADERRSPPTITLDREHFKLLDDFERRFPAGPPSLVRCRTFEVVGNVTFGAGVTVEGDVTVRGGERPSRIPDGAVLRSEHRA
ncbi:MAG: UTP--glucose-1-phosphate uridylyltransferase [Holophagae bacterium]